MTNLWLLIPAPIRRALVWIGVAVAAAWGFYFAGRRAADNDNETDELQNEVKAHDRLNKVPTGDGLSDADLRKHLREYSKRHGG